MEEVKQRAIEWLEGKKKSIEEGISILRDAGTEDVVITYYEKYKDKDIIRNKLSGDIRRVIYKKIEAPAKGDKGTAFILVDNNEVVSVDKINGSEYPNEVKAVLLSYNESYIKRSLLHKELKELGDENTDEIVAKRKEISDNIETLSQQQEVLHNMFKEYIKTGVLPTLTKNEDKEDNKDKNETQTDYNALPLEDLNKMKESNRVQLARVSNQLEYQSLTKAKKPNPMPASPRRIKLEKKLAKLTAVKDSIEMAIALKI